MSDRGPGGEGFSCLGCGGCLTVFVIAASLAFFAIAGADWLPEAVATLGEALTGAGLTVTNEVYAGASHGYSMADTDVYDEAATERHFTQLRALLARTL